MTDIDLLLVPVGVGLTVLCQLLPFPHGSFRRHDQRVAARVVALVLDEQLAEVVEVEGRLRNQASARSDIAGVERRETGITAEDPEDPDALVRAERRALPVDQVLGARDGRGEPDAVLTTPHVVVHGLRDRDHRHATIVQMRREAQRVVATDGNQRPHPELLQLVHDHGSEVVKVAVER